MNGQRSDLLCAGKRPQNSVIISFTRLDETWKGGPLVKALEQCCNRLEAQPRAAPIQPRQRIEPMGLDRLDNLRIKRSLPSCGAKGAVAHMSTRTPGNLRDLGGI